MTVTPPALLALAPCALRANPGTFYYMSTTPDSSLPGPWVEAFWADLGMPLRSKSNFRRGGANKDEWARHRRFEADVATVLRVSVPLTWEIGSASDPVAARPVVVSVIMAVSLLDAGNFSKSVLDAAEHTVFHNDASVAYTGSLSVRSASDQNTVVAFARLNPGVSTNEILDAADHLARALNDRFSR